MSRALTFWNDETIKLIQENFIAASVPTWLCRAKTPEGEFLRSAGIHKQWVTSSGYMSCVSASGKKLGRRPSKEVLEKFRQLPERERKPGTVQVPDLKPSEQVIPSPPKNGMVLRVHARFLTQDDDDTLRHAKTTDFPLMRAKPRVLESWKRFLEPNTEYMWLTQKECKALVPESPKKGQTVPVDRIIAERMARFHLTPQRATTSEGHIVRKRAVKSAKLSLVVRDVTAKHVRMKLTGFIHWGSDFDAAKATTPNGPLRQGFATHVYGRLEFDRKKNAFTRVDIVAPGHVWGRWGDANGRSMYVEQPGRTPFGFAFELTTGESPSDRIPPGGNGAYVSDRTGYFGK
ncbi:MAG: hypothetical protein ACFCD0_08600 [Gemmataceae bacterium]